tara:strand:+ start:1943 stop:3235 length:1293 start_codon:yes stop_codon:yes gene_type:complete
MPFFYSTDLKSQTLDPASDITNQKCTFRFADDTAYYPNLRLANLGSFGGVDHEYNAIAGCYGAIRHIRLVSNGVELDAMRFANRYLAWRNLLNTNRDNSSVNRKLTKNQLGFQIQPTGHEVSAGRSGAENSTGTTRDESKLGHLDLRLCLPLLENMPVIDTAVFKNLILEIEWERDTKRLITRDNVAQTIQTPLLIAEEITSPTLRQSLTKGFTGSIWNKVEHDVINIAEINTGIAAAGDTNEVNSVQQLNAFDDKFVSRLVLMKTYSDKSKYVNANIIDGFGDFGSLAPHKEKIQLKVNGANVFPQPLEHPSTKAMITFDAWGKVNLPPYAMNESVGADRDGQAQANLSGAVPPKDANNKQRGLVGNGGFFGCSLNTKIGNLSLDYTRTGMNNGTATAPDHDALDVHAYAECRKALQINSNGSFVVSYA